MKLLSLLVLLLLLSFHSQCQNNNPDSLLFLKAKKAFQKFELEHGGYIQTPNVKMHYLTWGNRNGMPLVWIHGTYSNAYEFYEYADSLILHAYYIIAIDYYGHGLTPIPEKDVSLYHVADDIKILLDYLKIDKTVIGGFSRGGSIATAFYDTYPEAVLGIILEDGGSVAWPTADHNESIDSLSASLISDFEEFSKTMNPEFNSEYEAVKEYSDLNFESSVFRALSSVKQNKSGKWQSDPGLSEFLGEQTAGDILNLMYRPFSSPHLFGASTALIFPKIIYRNLHVPLLILDPVSERDRFPYEEENEELQKQHPELIIHKIYNDSSHGLKFQHPVKFLGDVLLFLNTVKDFHSTRN